MAGPLSGQRIIEIAGIGPGPFAAMMLADMGAEVVRVERVQSVRSPAPAQPHGDLLLRGRKNVALDLKSPAAVEALLSMVESADAIIEGFRPGVMERLGIGPDACLARNPRIVFGRMTGWGQEGMYANAAGHDINYIALSGSLAHFARPGEVPLPPLNMVGDFGGGGMFLAYGVVCALLEAAKSGKGQVVDAAMIDGAAVLMTMFWAFKASGAFDENKPGTNLLDTGAHFYEVYRCKDGKFVTVGAIEPQFYAEFLRLTGLDADPDFASQMDQTRWPALKEKVAAVFATKTRQEWCDIMETTDVCFAPVLTMSEAAEHPHNRGRGTFATANGAVQPAPAPRLSRTPGSIGSAPAHPGQHTAEVLRAWGVADVDGLLASGAARQA